MGRFVTSVVVTAALAVTAAVAWDEFSDTAAKLVPDECLAEVGDLRARVTPEQGRNAALITAIGVERGLPPRAATIALATVFQESRMYNIDYGDRDSVGLFQQRPSQGWGSVAEIMDPVYSANKFYDGLVKVKGYTSMEITVAAQAVQRSGFPNAYAQHEERARALASALTGQSAGSFSCRFNSIDGGKTTTVADRVSNRFGNLAGTPVIAGRSVTVTAATGDAAWSIAHWLSAYGKELGLASVKVDGKVWTGDDVGAAGWKTTSTTPNNKRQIVVTVKQPAA